MMSLRSIHCSPDVTGVVLAGGKSRRMGEDKRFLTVGGAALLDRCVVAMREQFSEVLIITAQDSLPLEGRGCPVYQDLIAQCGSLGGLYTGLRMASHGRVFVVACDMPFLKPELIRWFLTRDPQADVVMGRVAGRLQPMHALYGKNALPCLERMARAGRLKIQDMVLEPSLRTTIVDASEWAHLDPESQSFRNVNTPADLEAARAEAARLPLAP
jgi:molybdenum cofactor guanylyltransferase